MGSFSGSWWFVDACPIITCPLSICSCPSPSLCHHLRCLRKTQFSAPEAKKERGDDEEMRLYSSLTLTFFLCLKLTGFDNFFSLISRVPCTSTGDWLFAVPSVRSMPRVSGSRRQNRATTTGMLPKMAKGMALLYWSRGMISGARIPATLAMVEHSPTPVCLGERGAGVGRGQPSWAECGTSSHGRRKP